MGGGTGQDTGTNSCEETTQLGDQVKEGMQREREKTGYRQGGPAERAQGRALPKVRTGGKAGPAGGKKSVDGQ